MNSIFFNIIVAVVTVFIGAVVGELLPYLRQRKNEAMAKLRQTEWAWAADIIEAVVRAVEQTVSGKLYGLDKKKYAMNKIVPLLAKYGLELSEDEIDKLIEAAVQAINENTITVEKVETEEA